MLDDVSSAANAANAAIADPAPVIEDAPSTDVQLIRGIYNTDLAVWETQATVRELTGEDEEFLASFEAKGGVSYGEYLTTLLQRSVISIGSYEVEKMPHIIDDLIIGDRDLLFLGTIKATYGIMREFQMTCSFCGETNDVTIDLEKDFEIEHKDEDVSKPIAVTLKNGETVSFNYPTSGDSKYASKKGKTDAEQNSYIIGRCLISQMGRDERDVWAKKLSLSDRKKIIRALTRKQPGPRMGEVDTQCAYCEKDLTVVMDWVSLLFG
jgi:hypothetical protein